jgi:hypothetical protein
LACSSWQCTTSMASTNKIKQSRNLWLQKASLNAQEVWCFN